MKESNFNTEVVRSLRYYGWLAHKLSDVRGTRFTGEKPCDILACSPSGCFVAIESKQMKKYERLKVGALRPNQIATLDKAIENNGRAFLLVNVRIPRVHNVCVALDWNEHRDAIVEGWYDADWFREDYYFSIGHATDGGKKLIWLLSNLLDL